MNTVLTEKGLRVHLGGSWHYDCVYTQLSDIFRNGVGFSHNDLGLRLVRSATPLEQLAEIGISTSKNKVHDEGTHV